MTMVCLRTDFLGIVLNSEKFYIASYNMTNLVFVNKKIIFDYYDIV